MTIENSIVAGNFDDGTAPDLRPDFTGTRTVDFSLIGDTTGSGITAGTGSGNILNQSALLGPLANNGGPTETHALLVGSLAIDAGDPSFDVVAIPNDQRGAPFLREVGARVDIGAYERQTLDLSFFIVTTTADELDYSNTDVSLREAINSTNGSIGFDAITFDAALSGQTITLGGTELAITEALTIDATALAANVTIDANMQSRVLNITATTGDFMLAGLTLTGGLTAGGGSPGSGGAVRSLTSGNLTLDQSTISGNSTTGSFTYGGGIFTTSGDVTLTRSTVSGNSTMGSFTGGGGIRTLSGNVTLTSSTVSGNNSSADGGGIWTSSGEVTLSSSTVTGNSAVGAGGGVFVRDTSSDPTLTISNSIVAGNTDNGTAADLRPDPDSTLTISYSLIGVADNLGTITGNVGNQTGTAANPLDPLLGPLQNNGGLTKTHALQLSSPAIDAGDPAIVSPPPFDQRGAPFVRVFDDPVALGSGIDIGAFELQPIAPSADFDSSGFITGFDFLAWQRGFGTTTGAAKSDGDADNDQDVDADDLGFWESQFGGPAPLAALSASATTEPENEPSPLTAIALTASAPLAPPRSAASIEATPVAEAEQPAATLAARTSLAFISQMANGVQVVSRLGSHLNTARDNYFEANGLLESNHLDEYVDLAFDKAWDDFDSLALEHGDLIRKITNHAQRGHLPSHAQAADNLFATLAEEEGFSRLHVSYDLL